MHGEAVLVLHAARHRDLDPETLELLDSHLNKAVENAPRSDYVRFVCAVFDLWGRSETEDAKKDIDRCLSINPSYPWGLFAKGLYHAAKSEFDPAIRALEKAILLSESDPLLPQILFVASEVLICAGQYQQALERIEHAIQLRPSQWAFFVIRGLILENIGDSKLAESSFKKASSLDREPLVLAPRISLPTENPVSLKALIPDMAIRDA